MILMRGIGVPPLIKRHHRTRSMYTRARRMCRRTKIEVRVDTRRWYQSFQGAEDCRTAGFRLGLCQLGVILGHCGDVRCTTALPPKAEVDLQSCYVAEVPKAAVSRCNRIRLTLLDHLVGAG